MVNFYIYHTKSEMAKAAANKAAQIFKSTLKIKEKVNFVAATGSSQFEFLESLCKHKNIDWNKTEMFHLDEYVDISSTHPASFRNYLTKRLIENVHPGKVNFIKGDAPNSVLECERLNKIISVKNLDVAFVGIGENGHLAFNDPPADFETKKPYIVVNLDEKCRQQQVREGWFTSLKDVPKKAITMSINEIMRVNSIICICPDKRKAEAVRDCLSDKAKITPKHPASILKKHPQVYCYLDKESASLINS